jgi:hypothetical protein
LAAKQDWDRGRDAIASVAGSCIMLFPSLDKKIKMCPPVLDEQLLKKKEQTPNSYQGSSYCS